MVVYEACWTVIPRASDIGTKAGLARDPLTVFFQTSRCNRQRYVLSHVILSAESNKTTYILIHVGQF